MSDASQGGTPATPADQPARPKTAARKTVTKKAAAPRKVAGQKKTAPRAEATHASGLNLLETRARARQIARQHEILQMLLDQKREPLAVEVVAERLHSSVRTIERDLEHIRAANLPVHGRGGRGGGVWLDVTRNHRPLDLATDQVMALVLVLDNLTDVLPGSLAEIRTLLEAQLVDPALF